MSGQRDQRVPVSRGNYAVVVDLYGSHHASECYRHEPSLDASDDRVPERRIHILTAAERRALDEGE